MDAFFGDFEWDSRKSEANLEKHGISFMDVLELFEAPYVTISSDRPTEVRWLAVGEVAGRVVAVVYTERSGRKRLISARMARSYEREAYYAHIGEAR
ncbi:hypothetical protein MSC49_10000 [Methylosinus sp. C49]|uniref:BrnT family toxin n=1 Tax=Methylosinus sp. C49 TaxID=2699395 RepID=UPI001366A760|nr:BrnT family toxin [Methylosinus sp. C49]BBU61065.1 hypothetical protein MSC49_10000 [Methylosinus sp. C49]